MTSPIAGSKFIYLDPNDDSKVIVDGKGAGKNQKTKIDDKEIVQLGRARTEESGFQWERLKIKQVELRNVIATDEVDITCLIWFIYQRIKIKCSSENPFVSPAISGRLTCELENLELKVIPGSTITIPLESSLTGYGKKDALEAACKKVGFEVKFF